jgi:predicted DNA-binding protein
MSESLVNGVDSVRIPRVFPHDTKVIDVFPLTSISERLYGPTADLLGQLALAEAPFSGRETACILAGADRGYGGHVVEHSVDNAEDPFAMALAQVPDDAQLYGIMVTGKGALKEKHVLPSGEMYDAIQPHLVPDSPIIVIPPNQIAVCRRIPYDWHQRTYRPKPLSAFVGETVAEIYREAIEKTVLSVEDCMFLAKLRLAGLRDGIHYYLTGSANGQSGPSVATRPGVYSDLDIIAASSLGRGQVESSFEKLAANYYGALQKTSKLVRVVGGGRTVEGSMYVNGEIGLMIDLFVTSQPEDGFVRSEYLARNFFHQLS